MEVVYDEETFRATSPTPLSLPERGARRPASSRTRSRSHRRALCDGAEVYIGGIMGSSRRPASTPVTRPVRCHRSRWARSDIAGEVRRPLKPCARHRRWWDNSACSTRSRMTCCVGSQPSEPCRPFCIQGHSGATRRPCARIMLGATIANCAPKRWRSPGMAPAAQNAPS